MTIVRVQTPRASTGREQQLVVRVLFSLAVGYEFPDAIDPDGASIEIKGDSRPGWIPPDRVEGLALHVDPSAENIDSGSG
jgi:hypothetical protein